MCSICTTYLFLLLVKIVNDDTDEEVQCEERPEDDENHKVKVHVQIAFPLRLLLTLQRERGKCGNHTTSAHIKILMQSKQSCPSEIKAMKHEKSAVTPVSNQLSSVSEVCHWHLQCHRHFSNTSQHCHSNHTAPKSATPE